MLLIVGVSLSQVLKSNLCILALQGMTKHPNPDHRGPYAHTMAQARRKKIKKNQVLRTKAVARLLLHPMTVYDESIVHRQRYVNRSQFYPGCGGDGRGRMMMGTAAAETGSHVRRASPSPPATWCAAPAGKALSPRPPPCPTPSINAGLAPRRAYLEQRQPPPPSSQSERACSTCGFLGVREMGRQPCCDKVGVKKGPWTAEEDQKLVGFLLTHGHCCWRVVPKLAGLLRCGKSCRLRWTNYLRPDLKRGLLSDDEERLVIDLHAQLGNRWSKIAAQLPGRTDNEIKNHWNTHIRKKLLRMGIDPVTHLPLQQAPAPPPEQEQEQQEQPQEQQPQSDGGERMQEGGAGEGDDLPMIQPHEIAAPPAPPAAAAASNCGSVSSASAGSASVVSPSYSSSASASAASVSGVEATEWPEPLYLLGMDSIMDAGWDDLFPSAGAGVDPFDGYPAAGFDQGDDWM